MTGYGGPLRDIVLPEASVRQVANGELASGVDVDALADCATSE